MPTLDRYITPLKLPMSIDLFWRFPHVPAYRAEYREGHAELTYQPRLNMARLRVAVRPERKLEDVVIRPLNPTAAHDDLAKLFVLAFAKIPPLDAMPATTRRHAVDAALKHTASGGDGEVFRPACFVAANPKTGELLGAAIVTEIGLRSDEWPEATLPAKLLNLTWLFVAPKNQRHHIGSALLDRVINVLAEKKMPWLVSHFFEDNATAMLFHWRHGFELVSWIRRAEG